MNSDDNLVREVDGDDMFKSDPPIEEPKQEPINEDGESKDTDNTAAKKRKKAPVLGKKPSAEALQRRKEGRMKAAATIANNLKKTGIGRFEEENGFRLTSVKQIPLINQKNYYTDYLKKDEQVSFIRNWRMEKLLQQKIKNLKKDDLKKEESEGTGSDSRAESLSLKDIENETNEKKAVVEEDEEEEEEDENDNEELSEEKAKLGYDTIVIQPGSENIRIGRATNAYPKTIPTVIAVPNVNKDEDIPLSPERSYNEDGDVIFSEQFKEAKELVTKDFKARMKYYKRRILPNSREAAINFNRRQEPEKIPDHNDPMKKDWLDLSSDKNKNQKFFVGEDAFNLPISDKFRDWKLRYPIVAGKFNEFSDDYSSPQEILGDLCNILTEALKLLDIKLLQTPGLKAILIIPDLYDKMYVENWCELLLKHVGFGKVSVIQEAVLATFGAGSSSACIVDVGAQTTSVTCVEEGMVINDSRILLDYGGDNITETFIKILLQSHFPYKEINLNNRNDDWELAQTLKHNYVTLQDADVSVQHYHFYKSKPSERTEKYEFKVFDEVMLAPLGLFYPELFEVKEKREKKKLLFSPSEDQYTGLSNNPSSRSQENGIEKMSFSDLADGDLLARLQEERSKKTSNAISKVKSTDAADLRQFYTNCTMPLEKAIIESITNACLSTDFSKAKKLYDNIIIVGGGLAKIPGYDLLLTDRINIWRPKYLSTSTIDEILEYVSKERAACEQKRQNLIEEHKTRKQQKDQPLEEVELDDSELEHIEEETQLLLDLDHLDSVCDNGLLLPVTILPPPREFDPAMLTWKGGSVYGRIKVASEMWISSDDWNLLQSRSLYYKTLFTY